MPVANSPLNANELCERLLQEHPEAPFAAVYFDRPDGQRSWELRSRSGFDVSRVASKFGGGGHASAAGFVEKTVRPVDV